MIQLYSSIVYNYNYRFFGASHSVIEWICSKQWWIQPRTNLAVDENGGLCCAEPAAKLALLAVEGVLELQVLKCQENRKCFKRMAMWAPKWIAIEKPFIHVHGGTFRIFRQALKVFDGFWLILSHHQKAFATLCHCFCHWSSHVSYGDASLWQLLSSFF